MDKKAMNGLVKWILIILILGVIIVGVGGGYYSNSCELTDLENEEVSNYSDYEEKLEIYNQFLKDNKTYQEYLRDSAAYYSLPEEERAKSDPPTDVDEPKAISPPKNVDGPSRFTKFKISIGCKGDYGGIIGSGKNFFKEKLGFNEGFFSFFYPHMVVGLMAGLWIWLLYEFAHFTNRFLPKAKIGKVHPFSVGRATGQGRLRRSWLHLIGSSFWKILIIGLIYAVLMELPFIHTFLDIALLAFLRDNYILRSFILAFYIGLLPSAIEEFSKYKIRKHRKQIKK